MIKAKLPDGVSLEQAKGALVTLAADPNFEILCKFIDKNDVDSMRTRLEDENISEEDARKARYQIKLMREIRGMPIKILNALENEGKPRPEEDDGDPYEK